MHSLYAPTVIMSMIICSELKGPSGNPLDVLEGSRRSNTAPACDYGASISANVSA